MTEVQPNYHALLESHLHIDAETAAAFTSQQSTPLDPTGAANGTDSGLPPTPPSMSQDGQHSQDDEPLPQNKSSLSTPVNARSPPTPDPSPPRTNASIAAPERPHMFTYPSSRAESFKTAREEPSSEASISPALTPLGDRLSTVEEDRGLGLAFEHDNHDDHDVTPTDTTQPTSPAMVEGVARREWNTEFMRNVTIRKKPKPVVNTASPSSTPSPSPRPRRHSSLRERVQASTNSPVTPSVENFAQSIGWPSEDQVASPEKPHDDEDKRNSTSSMASSTVVEASIIVTPPRRRQTLRRSGKNMAYREGSPTPDTSSQRHPNRQSFQSDVVPLHRLVHKRVSLADRARRISTDSEALGTDRSVSSPLSFRSRIIDSSAATLYHQESLRRVLQPAADILSRSNSRSRQYYSGQGYYTRISSAPEPRPASGLSFAPRNYSHLPPPPVIHHTANNASSQTPVGDHASAVPSPVPSTQFPRSQKKQYPSNPVEAKQPADINKSLPSVPREVDEPPHFAGEDAVLGASEPVEAQHPPSALLERVRQLIAKEITNETPTLIEAKSTPKSPEQLSTFSSPQESSPPVRRGSRSLRGRSAEQRRSSLSQDRTSISPEVLIRPSLDVSTEEMPHRSYEWRRPSEEHRRVSFDRSTIRTEHAGARHQFLSTTPFSQFSDTPIEVSEATAVSIFPHNNHSLLVVQQMSRANSMAPEAQQLTDGSYFFPRDYSEIRSTPTPPFVDANEDHDDRGQTLQPTLTIEPSTPPMQIALPQPATVDSPLENPRPPPEPPKILFIPPTPAEELERQLVPGPPKRSDSHPQRRLSLVQRARRYSDNLIPTLLSRASSNRGRYTNDPHARRSHRSPQVPTVNDEDGALHPFWRPRGFWDEFEDSETESEEELPRGGDTSDVEPDPPAPPKRSNTLGKRLTGGIRGSGGFLIGNSLGVERYGTNKRRHHITLPSTLSKPPKTSPDSPKVLIQPPTIATLGPHSGGGISKRSSRSSLRSHERPQRRASWRQGRSLPGLKKYHVQYIGLSGVKERFKEGRREKRRERIRQSIGSRYYVEQNGPNATLGTRSLRR
ncbi:hypothetical protein GQ44DRAFT_687947 [Phaeosphaeriaceae sp. PMI808]|nr:hypothetical protein GQ44DRAFT_687947 [Phaeosphaeriaceae sp. PMI808]